MRASRTAARTFRSAPARRRCRGSRSRSTTGSRRSRRPGWRSTPAICSRSGAATCSSALWPGAISSGSCSTANGSSPRRSCSRSSTRGSARCGKDRTARCTCSPAIRWSRSLRAGGVERSGVLAMGMPANTLPTAVVGSFPQPDWLVDRALLRKHMAPRVRVQEIWRIPPEHLEEAQDDATIVAIRAQERAGIDIVTDGEIRRESYSNAFANALDGIDRERHGEIVGRTGAKIPVPLVTGPIRRREPVEVRDVRFLRANTDRVVKITLPGPFTMAQQAIDEHYGSRESLALAYAEAVR